MINSLSNNDTNRTKCLFQKTSKFGYMQDVKVISKFYLRPFKLNAFDLKNSISCLIYNGAFSPKEKQRRVGMLNKLTVIFSRGT